MKKSIRFRSAFRFVVIFILIYLLIPSNVSIADRPKWNSSWSFSQEIDIPFDTSLDIAHFQPIDTNVVFENPCWAKDTINHSIRLCCWDGNIWHELESQIYNLESTSSNMITSSNIVFLIPEFADGNEKYFIYYDESEKPSPNYIDHVKIEESYYRYEPIPGYPLESYYYKLIDDDFITYSVAYKGKLMGYNTGQHVVKLKENIVEVLPKNGELFAAFDFKYYYDDDVFSYSSTSQKVLSKEILIDGNLMLEFKITSTSNLKDLKTTANYKYYHCPAKDTRIHVQVKHETLKEIEVYEIPPATNADGVYASIQCGGLKSKSIQELNIGRILPYMHFFNEMGKTSEYILDLDPEYIPDNLDIRIVSVEDNLDLGNYPWFSFDEGKTGECHSVIFSSNEVLKSGKSERDGLQLNAFELDYPHLPGLENNIATIQIGRNSVESGDSHDLIIPDDFVVEFTAEFFSTKTGGYKIVNQEAEIFQELVKIKPKATDEIDEESDDIETHDLSVYVYFANSFPLGSSLSALTGLNLSFINVEIYKDDKFLVSGNAVRLPIKAFEELDDPTFFEQVVALLKIFDVKNISIFKKVTFPELIAGKYVIKVFKENPLISKEKQYIGYAIVDLQKKENVNIFCRTEGEIDLTITDQNNNRVKDAIVLLQKEETNIAKQITDTNGHVTIKAPTDSKNYNLKIYYNGHNIFEETVRLGILSRLKTIEKKINIERYNLFVNIRDTWDEKPEIDLNPVLNFEQSDEVVSISAEKFSNDRFLLKNLIPDRYQIVLTYKSFTLRKEIDISKDKEIDIQFPAEYKVKFDINDARGLPIDSSTVFLKRNNKILKIQNQGSVKAVSIPPGYYRVDIYSEEELIGSRNINIYGEQNFDLLTKKEPVFPSIVLIGGYIILIFAFFAFFLYKRNLKHFQKILIIILIIISIFLPWWEINGSADNIKSSTKLYLVPNKMITFTSSTETIAGEPSFLPDEFQLATNMIILFSVLGCAILLINQLIEKRYKKKLIKITFLLSILLIVLSLGVFLISIGELSKYSIGSIFGEGYLETSVPGESGIQSVLSHWGPSYGFFIYLISIFILFIPLVLDFIKKRINR